MEQKLVDAELSYARCPGKKWMRGTLYLGLKVSWFEMLEGGGLEKKFPPDSEDRARARRNGIHSLTEHVFWGRSWRYRDEEDRDAPRAPLKARRQTCGWVITLHGDTRAHFLGVHRVVGFRARILQNMSEGRKRGGGFKTEGRTCANVWV